MDDFLVEFCCSGWICLFEIYIFVLGSMNTSTRERRARGRRESLRSENVSDIRGDEKNVAVLFFLYLLQGIPLGLTAAVPMYLQNRGVSYRQQAEFSFANWPFSLKLLWAPVIDSLYLARFGRRKSWLIPIQYCIGLFMIFLSVNVTQLLSKEVDISYSVSVLTTFFFCLNFLAATQDIVVDGWALTMLKRVNVGYASTCNSVGQTAGYFLGYVVFMGLESADFCNTYLRSTPKEEGLISLSGFLLFWGWIFLITTTLVAIFKKDCETGVSDMDSNLGIKETYYLLLNILKLPAIKITVAVLLTCKIGFAACDSVTSLKLIEAGVPKEKLALMAVPLVPLQIILPLIISKYTVGPHPMKLFLRAVPYRLLFGLLAAALVWGTPKMLHYMGNSYYVLLVVIYSIHQVAVNSMFVAIMAFFARISDPAVGGTYMTLLNTLTNLGGNWPSTLALWLVDVLTFKSCTNDSSNQCLSEFDVTACKNLDGQCSIWLDGYYLESIACVVIGFIWLSWGESKIKKLQTIRESEWKVVHWRAH